MRAIVSSVKGPVLQDVAQPSPGPGQVLVKVHASSLNRADLAMLKGAAHGKTGGLGSPLGLEWAGEVVEVGPEVTQWEIGSRVMGASGGALAQYVIGFAPLIYAMPNNLSYEQAACFPVAMQTMHDALSSNGHLEAGQSVLIQGASSAVGLMGMQVAKYLGAKTIVGTSTTAERRERLSEFGADVVLDSRSDDWVEQVHQATGGDGVDLVVDLLAGPLMNANLKATRIGGRIVNVGRMAGEVGEVDFDLHSMRRITYVGVTFRTRSLKEIIELIGLTKKVLGPALEEGVLNLPIDKIYPLADAAEAFEHMAQNKHFGKIVLSLD